jgi:hypothetical protein
LTRLIFISLRLISKMAKEYAKDSISALSRKEYLEFFEELFPVAFLVGDWPPARRAYASESAISRAPLPEMKSGQTRFSSRNTYRSWNEAVGRIPMSFRRLSPRNVFRPMWYPPCKRKK